MISHLPVEWRTSAGLVPYPEALAFMEERAAAIADGQAPETVWLLEHPPLYTAGTSTQAGDLLQPDRFPVYQTGRGGQYTYHGPGQRVGYVMLNVKARGGDIRRFVQSLEEWLIRTLASLGVTGERREGRVGIWVADPVTGAESKVAALGLRIRRGVSFHGVSLNVQPDLSHFAGIVPCGIKAHGVTSLNQLGKSTSMAEVDDALHAAFQSVFGAAPALKVKQG
jgi:lipoyl(octanoyl) transferase